MDIREMEEILDKKEKEYLLGVIRPFQNRVKAITKCNYENYENEEWIYFSLNGESGIDDFALPIFEKNTMYKGMEVNTKYTLEELGL